MIRRRAALLSLLLLGLPLVAACKPTSTFPGPAECRLGTGIFYFVPYVGGDRVPIIHGPQGGYHIWGATRIRWMEPSKVNLVFSIFVGGTKVSTVPTTVNLDAIAPAPPDMAIGMDGGGDGGEDGGEASDSEGMTGEEGWMESLANFVYLPDPKAVADKTIVMRLDATQSDGSRSCSDEHEVVPYQP